MFKIHMPGNLICGPLRGIGFYRIFSEVALNTGKIGDALCRGQNLLSNLFAVNIIVLEGLDQSGIDKKVMRESLKRIIIVSILDLHEFC